ncbi:L-arabinose isomerase [Caproiciproducens galactitolivorans]|uniref:L-arabinose isomerase n=1 Tax=Caproiciproducens galactitolivorans TaxID=642589 RepID=A0A4Z0YLG7_9FIRM|nr:L-arabinose isomerase [Caproiciproducens galactitolivorans]QEY35795.1 L-arabinose isomerase [Caproiciproducens galactitolivorans]TGJ77532.1 L-arabinose isomerase [Caproiciproducens galactitolivorans]
MSTLKKYEFWFVVGSQDLYGENVLKTVDRHSQIMIDEWNTDPSIPCTLVFKPVVRNSEEICKVIAEANNAPRCAGIITWMHTFSPSKMWIRGFSALQKPLLHLNTQFNRDIPWDDIDMDFMNLNQSAHGDREHGFILARMRIAQKVISGYWKDPVMRERMGRWMRAAVGAFESRRLRVLRISDNMREVAVTEGDKVEAHIKFGWQVDHYGVGDIIRMVDAVTEEEIDAQMKAYMEVYDMATDNLESVRYQAREEVALRKFMEEGKFGAFHTNFQDLQQLRQLPGLAAQDLMRLGYGFAGEGDWKTAALCRIIKLMTADCQGGTAFMEDYTYNFDPECAMNMGAHMLEVCPSIAADRPKIKVVPLGIGDREDPARLTFKAKAGPAVLATIIDMGDRFRMIVNDVECQEQVHEMPKLPVAAVLWKPLPNLETSAEAWIYAGGAHHSVLSYSITAEELRNFAEIMDIEFIHIGKETEINALCKELTWNELVWKLKK